MSFRKRSEVIGTPPGERRGIVPNLNRNAVPSRGPNVNPRFPGNQSVPRPGTSSDEVRDENDPTVRPSLVTSQPTVSTGTYDLDRILAHQGLPLGTSLLVEELGTTDFGAVLVRAFASQGIVHNRLEGKGKDDQKSHVIVVGFDSDWGHELPGVFKGSSKDKKRTMIASKESEVSVSNMAGGGPSARQDKDLKIAWRYGLNKKPESSGSNGGSGDSEGYSHQFDLRERLVPRASTNDISYVGLTLDYKQMISQILSIIKRQLLGNKAKTIRLIIPNLLIPSLYTPEHSQMEFIVPFIHSIRSLLRQYNQNLVMITSLPLDLYPRNSHITSMIELLMDCCIELQPFNQQMVQFLEKAYKNDPGKVQHGLVHIYKLPVLGEKGLMTIHDGEYAFKNGRKKFEIEEWGIPVDEEDEEKQTTKDIDF